MAAEKTVFGTTGRMTMGGLERIPAGGTRSIDRSLDSAEKMVDKFADALSKIVGTLSGIGSTGGAHRATSQSSVAIPNGGIFPPTTPAVSTMGTRTAAQVGGNWAFNTTPVVPPGSPEPSFGGVPGSPANGGGATFGPTSGGGAAPPSQPGGRHRAPAASGNGGNWGGRALGLAAVGLAAFTANHYSNQFLEQSVASQYSYGSDFSPAANAMFRNDYTAFNAQDSAQAANIQSTMGGYAPGSAQYAAQRTANQSISYADPTISNTQAAQAAVGFQSPSTFNRLQALGINPINAQGIVDIHQLAIQILAKVPWYTQIKTGAQIQAELYDPAGGIYVTLQSFMANGLIPAASYKAVQAAIGDILRAQIKGVSPASLATLEQQATDSNSPVAKSVLNQLGIGNSLAQTSKAKVGGQINTEVDTLGGFTKATKAATDALVGFRSFLNNVMQTTHTGGIVGGASGILGTLGGVLKVGGGYLLGRGAMGALRGGGGAAASLGRGAWGATKFAGKGFGSLFSRAAPVGSDILSGAEALAPEAGGALEFGAGLAGDAVEGGAGGMAPSMSSGMYSSTQVRGIGSLGAQRGGRSPGTGGSDPGQSQQAGNSATQGGGSSSGNAGISFIPPGPGVDSLDGETDFGPRNIGQGFHTGIDLMRGMQGATIKASATGEVTGAGWGSSGDSGYGNTVMINHGGGYVTMYAHMATITVSKGASVRQGQGIGTVGGTGSYARGPHLHFELHVNGKPVDPVPYISGKRGSYSGSPPSGTAGSSGGQTTTAQGTGSDMGTGSAFANGNKYGSTEEVDALASLLSGAAPGVSSSNWNSPGSSSSGVSGSLGSGSGSGSSGSGSSGSVPTGSPQAIAKKMLSQFGWSQDQFNPLNLLWTRESGWRWNATNPSSGAYGIPQSLPADKMASAGSDWKTNPATQIKWGEGYIKDRYGSPAGAWAHSQQTGWYDKGSWEIKKDELAMVHQGELIAPKKDADVIRNALTGGGGGRQTSITFAAGAIVVQLTGPVSQSDADEAGRMIVDAVVSDERMNLLATGAMYGK